MAITLSTALTKAWNFARARISKVDGLTKPKKKFFCWLLERWCMLPVRYNFLNLGRYGGYAEKSIRNALSKKLPFPSLFHGFFESLTKKDCIAVFDPCFLYKSGSKTHGLAKFWNGTAQRAEKGLEAGCLSLVDTRDATAYSLEVVQTPACAGKESIVDHYAKVITDRIKDIIKYTSILAVDGYFMKQGFIKKMINAGLRVITKGRQDANMRYLYKGPQHKGKGRKKTYDGKVDFQNIDKRRWRLCNNDDDGVTVYEAVLWSVTLKRKVKVVYVKAESRKSYEVLLCTDTELKGETILKHYRLRFQIEFLIRDAKSHAGLEHCQARSEGKLYNHFNMAMLSVSLTKYRIWAQLPGRQEVPFSMRAVKICCMNKYMTDTIFSNLALDLSCKKIKRLYNQCLGIGQIAA